MSTTKIEWAESTWNPITGCTKISPGCKNCYAERMAKRLAGRFGYPEYDPFAVTLHRDKFELPNWRKPRMVFVCSMGDLFHEDVTIGALTHVLDVIGQHPRHTFLILTKRPERIWPMFSGKHPASNKPDGPSTWRYMSEGTIIPNVWLGVTAENQEQADKRIPVLLQIPAVKRFVSIEPMLGPVDLSDKLGDWTNCPECGRGVAIDEDGLCVSCGADAYHWGLDWVILGGETGPGWRNMDPQWARDVRDQCNAAGVPFFMKKTAGGGQPPDDLMIREYPS